MKVLAVTNLYPHDAAPAQGSFIEQQIRGLRSRGLDVQVLFINRREQGMASYRKLPVQLRSAISAFDPDLVHVMYGGVMANLATRAVQDRPTVVTFHGSDLLGEHLSGLVRKIAAGYGVVASRRAALRASGVVVVSNALRQHLPKGLDDARVRVIPCGIDLARFQASDPALCRRQLGWNPDHFHVLFNSNGDDPVKRPDLARAAIAALGESGVMVEFHELRGVRNEEVPRWLNASHALLLTSMHEGSPTIVKEALACNLPIVSVDVGDVRDRIGGLDGCFICGGSARELADGLHQVYRRDGRIDGRSRIDELSLERISGSLVEFYESLVRRVG